MTEDRDFKRRVRERAARTGRSYQATKRSLEEGAATAPGGAPSGHELHRLAVGWLNTHWRARERTCLVCGADDLAIGVDTLRAESASGDHDGAEYLPVLCLTCGHTHLFDLSVVLGPPRGTLGDR
jgi:hypothetical protein